MHRCGSGFLLTLAITFVAALTGCLGKSTSNAASEGVSSVSLSPTDRISIDVGSTQPFSATARNASGGVVLGAAVQFIVQSGSPNSSAPLSIASNGNACAGTWDASDAVCSPGTTGIALVQAVANGVSSPVTTVYVHQHIDSIQIRSSETKPPQYDCFSQGQVWQYEGTAYNNNVDITNTIGPIDWTFNNTGVVTVATSSTVPTLLPSQVQTTAKSPGIAQLFATVSGTTSAPFPFTTCLIQAIYLQIGSQGQAGNSITVNNGGSVPVTAIAVDTLCGIANNTPLTNPPLTWSTTDPEVAAFSGTTGTTGSNSATARNNLGGATLFASCSPPSCNIGVLPGLPVYSSNYDATAPPTSCRPLNLSKGYATISVDVSTISTPPTYTAWAATTDCQNQPGCSSAMFDVTPTPSGKNPIGTILSLPRTPNSIMFNHVAAGRLYIGSNQGLMFADVGGSNPTATLVSSSPTPCNVALCGKVLAISNDGKLVVVSDTVSTPSQVYIFNGGSSTAPIDLIIPGETATAAAFSPDQLKVFILTNTGNMYVYSTVDALTSVPIATSVTDVKFSADGSFAYVAGAPASAVSAYSTCSQPNIGSVDIGTAATTSTPLQIFPSPVIPPPVSVDGFLWTTQTVLALEPPSIEFLTAQFRQDPIGDGEFTCNPPVILPGSFKKGASFNLGQGNFNPVYTQLVADGTEVIVVARKIPAVLLFNVSSGTTTSIPLVGNTDPLAADASTDGSQVYITACDQYAQDGKTCIAGSVHIVNTISQGDFQQVPYININDNNDVNMCNSQGGNAPLCLPNLIAIRPQ
jgi:hypothetical protein